MVLKCSVVGLTTGYGNQTKLFTGRIQGLGHEVGITAFYGLEGAILEVQGPRGLIPVYPKGYDMYGQDVWSAAAKHFGADVCISLMDSWVFGIDQNPHNIPWVPWFPVDSDPLPPRIIKQVSRAHKRIVFSQFGKRVVEEAGLDCYYVPHGVDTSVFTPIPQKAAREFLRLPQDKFIVGMVAANKGNPSRKAFTQNIEAFAQFHKTHPDALLYLHTSRGERGEEGGVNLPEFCAYMGLVEGEDVLFADQYMYILSMPDYHMANLYSSFDVHLLVSMGEGFGIPILEAQACGCPVIVGDWTSMSELCFGGWKVSKRDTIKYWNPLATYQWLPKPEAIAEKLEAAYKMRGVDSIRQRAREGALQYDADKVAEKYWKPVLEDIERSLSDKHRHKWHTVGVWSDDKTLSVPCVECGAELVLDERRVQKRIVPNGFQNSLDLKFIDPDGLEWILLREAEREYDSGLDLNENSRVIDIGAHVGVISMYLAKKYGCEVWAVEPNKRNRDILLERTFKRTDCKTGYTAFRLP